MGYQVESYSLSELQRIAVPGAVSPSLFWALPVGDWNPAELNGVWSWFTERRSQCNDYGLLLVKDRARRTGDNFDVSLGTVGAKISDLLPGGSEHFVRSAESWDRSSRVLILSGGYPQPGWGVLIEWRFQGMQLFEELIMRACSRLRRGCEESDPLRVFDEASRSFHDWRALRVAPASDDLSSLKKEIVAAEKIELLIRASERALYEGHYRLVGEKIIASIQTIPQAPWLDLSENNLQSQLKAQRTVLGAASIAALSPGDLSTEIQPKLETLAADPSQKEAIFRSLTNDDLKHAFKACLHLWTGGIAANTKECHSWAKDALAEKVPELAAALQEMAEAIAVKLLPRRGAKARREHENTVRAERWRQDSKKARNRFHRDAEIASRAQWALGPQFLVEFEQICRNAGLWIRSVPWDPARMIGWKIMAAEVQLTLHDLQIAAQELAPAVAGIPPESGETNAIADGSYFTDYVHYIAISRPGFSPRSVTLDLVARLLRPTEMVDLINANGGDLPTATTASHIAEGLLNALGWSQLEEAREKPLASCVKAEGDRSPTLAGDLSGNDLRIILESFCKDVLDVVVAQLGYSHDEVWRVIQERIREYRPSSRTMDWEEEVQLLSSGGAAMLLAGLIPVAFPDAESPSELAAGIAELSEILNDASHHQASRAPSSDPLNKVPALIGQLLLKARALLGAMPWHLEASFVYGVQPKVLCGEAWSHGSATPRLLRVILWTGAVAGTRLTFWDKTRRNPIVTDPVFILRPRRA